MTELWKPKEGILCRPCFYLLDDLEKLQVADEIYIQVFSCLARKKITRIFKIYTEMICYLRFIRKNISVLLLKIKQKKRKLDLHWWQLSSNWSVNICFELLTFKQCIIYVWNQSFTFIEFLSFYVILSFYIY